MFTFTSKSFVPAVIAFGLTLGVPAIAVEEHDHGHVAEALQLRLDNGKKWQLDAVAHRAMSQVRTNLAQALPAIHSDTFTPVHYRRWPGASQIEDMTNNS